MKRLSSAVLFAYLFLLCAPANAQVISTVAGDGTSGYSGDGGYAVSAKLNHPDMVKFDGQGNMYIADEHNNAVRKVSVWGIITTIAGNGTADAYGRGGLATAAHLFRPTDIAFDKKGNIYIAEGGNNMISKIATNGLITTFAGNGVNGNIGDSVAATTAQLRNPIGLVFDEIGNLYFSSNGSGTIRKIDTNGYITTIAGTTGVLGYAGDNGPATAAELGLTGYLAFGPNKDLYIPDYLKHVVRRIDSFGVITTVAGNGAMGTAGDGGPATAANIGSPYSIFFDYKNDMYVSDRFEYLIRKVDGAGVISTICGTGVAGFDGDGDIPIATQFNADLNLSDSDKAGNYYIADPMNNRVRKIGRYTTGLKQVSNVQPVISVYPNPAHTVLNISSAGNSLIRVLVVDITGHTVIDHAFANTNKTEIDISSLSNGTYFLKVNERYAGSFVKD